MTHADSAILNSHIYDECRSDGLCLSTWYDNNVWRDFCTDSTWESPSCQKLCVNGTGLPYANNPANRTDTSVTVTPCNDGSYCCGHGNTAETCCANGNGVFLVNGEAKNVNPTASSSASKTAKATKAAGTKTAGTSRGPAAITVTAPASSTSAAVESDSPKKNHAGAIAGGVVGGIVLLALLAGLGWFLLRRRRTHASRSETVNGAYYSELPQKQAGNQQASFNQAGMASVSHEYYGRGDGKVQQGNNTHLDGLPRAELAPDINQGRAQLPQDQDGGSGVRHEMGPGS